MTDKSQARDENVPEPAEDDDPPLPPISEQMAEQLGGARGLIEAGVPVAVFVVLNILLDDRLEWVIGASVACAVGIAIVRAVRRQPIRHAVNGLFGISLGAILALRSGDANDFYLPGILWGLAYGVVFLGSTLIRHPLVGWGWSIIAGKGKSEWRHDARLMRVFTWLTVLWGAVFLVKNMFRLWLKLDGGYEHLLGVTTLVLGYPLTALLLLITLVSVRRVRPSMAIKETAPATSS
ncbi:MAG: DUF3159 domain-containing protein [Stackebrandtia sp.]